MKFNYFNRSAHYGSNFLQWHPIRNENQHPHSLTKCVTVLLATTWKNIVGLSRLM